MEIISLVGCCWTAQFLFRIIIDVDDECYYIAHRRIIELQQWIYSLVSTYVYTRTTHGKC
jgi:hypothetical protein